MTIELALMEGQGIIDTAAWRQLRNQFTRARRSGDLVQILPRILVPRDLADDPLTRLRAALAWNPRLILMGRAAARLTLLPDLALNQIDMAAPYPLNAPTGIRIHEVQVPRDLRSPVGVGHCTSPALTVFDLAMADDWLALCEGLRTRKVHLKLLQDAAGLLAGRHGAASRRECLARAARNPWSIPEMELHQLYLGAGLTDWEGNPAVYIGDRRVHPDVRFRRERVIAEVDGRAYHDGADRFEAERERHNLFVADGHTVLHFTPRMIRSFPQLVLDQTRAALEHARHRRHP